MLVCYALAEPAPVFILMCAGACAASSVYGFLQGATLARRESTSAETKRSKHSWEKNSRGSLLRAFDELPLTRHETLDVDD
jgi:hypothetical protein